MDKTIKAIVYVRHASYSPRRSRELALVPWYVAITDRESGKSVIVTTTVSRKGVLAEMIINDYACRQPKNTRLGYGELEIGKTAWGILEGLATFKTIHPKTFQALFVLLKHKKYGKALALLRAAKLLH